MGDGVQIMGFNDELWSTGNTFILRCLFIESNLISLNKVKVLEISIWCEIEFASFQSQILIKFQWRFFCLCFCWTDYLGRLQMRGLNILFLVGTLWFCLHSFVCVCVCVFEYTTACMWQLVCGLYQLCRLAALGLDGRTNAQSLRVHYPVSWLLIWVFWIL